MGCIFGRHLRDFYVDTVVPPDRYIAERGYCPTGVGRRIGDCWLSSFDCPLVWDGGLLSVRRYFAGQPQGPWFLLFFATASFGSAAYFYQVYKKQVPIEITVTSV
jgi:hypothetical protein